MQKWHITIAFTKPVCSCQMCQLRIAFQQFFYSHPAIEGKTEKMIDFLHHLHILWQHPAHFLFLFLLIFRPSEIDPWRMNQFFVDVCDAVKFITETHYLALPMGGIAAASDIMYSTFNHRFSVNEHYTLKINILAEIKINYFVRIPSFACIFATKIKA